MQQYDKNFYLADNNIYYKVTYCFLKKATEWPPFANALNLDDMLRGCRRICQFLSTISRRDRVSLGFYIDV